MRRSRQGWLAAVVGTAALITIIAGHADARTIVYVSNAIDGDIDTYAMVDATGALIAMGKTFAGMVVMPMAVSPNRRHLYAIVRSAPPRVMTFAIDPSTGALVKAAEAPLPEEMPNVSTDRAGRFLLTASYSGNEVAVSPIDRDGVVRKAPIQVVPTGEKAHSIQVDRTNRFAYATNLGSDQIVQFRFDAISGLLTPNTPPVLKTHPGDGPRHFVFSLDDTRLYVLHELSGVIAEYAIDPEQGTLSLLDTVESVPADAGLTRGTPGAAVSAQQTRTLRNLAEGEKRGIKAADIQITPDGRFLYTTERTSSRLAMFAVAREGGKLSFLGTVPTVTQPRGIKIDPSGRYLVASGERSDVVAVYRIEGTTGRLNAVGRYPGGKGANWVEIVDIP